MFTYLKNYFEENGIKFSEKKINKDELKKCDHSLYKLNLMEVDLDKQVLAIYPQYQNINKELLQNNLHIKNYKFIKNKISKNNIYKLLLPEDSFEKNFIDIYFQNENKVLSVNQNELKSNFDYKITEFSKDKLYRVSIRNVSPAQLKNQLCNYKKCFLGFSLGNDCFKGNRLKSMLAFIEKRFEVCNILLADYIYRNTIQIVSDLNRAEALEKSIELGEKIEAELIELTKNSSTKFIITKASDLIKEKQYFCYLSNFKKLYDQNEIFKEDVLNFSDKFLERNKTKTKTDIMLSKNYLIEELSLSACIIEKGYKVLLYPGDIQIFKDIADHKIENIPSVYKDLIKVTLKLKS